MNCGNRYDDEAQELIEGCECGSNLFLYKKSFDDEAAAEESEDLQETKENVMEEIDRFISDVTDKVSTSAEFEFDLESIRVQEDGVYEINLRKLLDEVPLIVEVKEGNYHIHLASVFTEGKEKDLRIDDLDADADLKERLREARDAEEAGDD
jgi:predicted  nucleic acid-binding Zn-ribbon protein